MSFQASKPRIVLFLRRWGPALVMMVAIFFFSSLPSNNVPDFGEYEFTVKKGGHILGYLILGRAVLSGIGAKKYAPWIALGICFLYALTDEFHQSFVPGRASSVFDVGIDTLGIIVGLLPAFLSYQSNPK